jgi:hypothetical protein
VLIASLSGRAKESIEAGGCNEYFAFSQAAINLSTPDQ